MSKKNNGVNYSRTVLVRVRRASVIERLQIQLTKGTKSTKNGQEQLSEKDILRINKEITTLKLRV